MRKIISIVMVLILLSSSVVIGNKMIPKIYINENLIEFEDQNPFIRDSRTFVPIRFVAENLGCTVSWDNENRVAIIEGLGKKIELPIGKNIIIKNGVTYNIDVASFIENKRTLVPIRFVSEHLGADVGWNQEEYAAYITLDISNTNGFSVNDIFIGDSKDKVIKNMGEPSRIDSSKYGFSWYIYNNDYEKYMQIGIKDEKVVGLYTNSDIFSNSEGIKIDTASSKVIDVYGEPLNSIKKGNTSYILPHNKNEVGTYLIEGSYVTFFYDIHNDNRVTSIQLIEKDVEEESDGFYGDISEEMKLSYQKQIFDLANGIRVRFGKTPFKWDDKTSEIAFNHSKDMALRSFFSHINPDGLDPFERMKEYDINFSKAAENIAAGQSSPIFAHEAWMNSEGHRKNILGDYDKLGVGTYFGGDYFVYYTQNFLTPY